MKSFFITVLTFSLQFSACLGMAMATQPVFASTVDVVQIEEPMSPLFVHGDVCEKAVTSWHISNPGEGTGCQDTTSCLQGSAHSLRDKTTLPIAQYDDVHPPVADFAWIESAIAANKYLGPPGPVPWHAMYPHYLTAQLE